MAPGLAHRGKPVHDRPAARQHRQRRAESLGQRCPHQYFGTALARVDPVRAERAAAVHPGQSQHLRIVEHQITTVLPGDARITRQRRRARDARAVAVRQQHRTPPPLAPALRQRRSRRHVTVREQLQGHAQRHRLLRAPARDRIGAAVGQQHQLLAAVAGRQHAEQVPEQMQRGRHQQRRLATLQLGQFSRQLARLGQFLQGGRLAQGELAPGRQHPRRMPHAQVQRAAKIGHVRQTPALFPAARACSASRWRSSTAGMVASAVVSRASIDKSTPVAAR